jgi:hypothetical protein
MGNPSYLIFFLVHIVLGVQFEHVQDFFTWGKKKELYTKRLYLGEKGSQVQRRVGK